MKKSSVYDCSIIELSRISIRAGSITAVESGKDIPFDIKRVYYLYDVPSGESRGGHAHKELRQLIIAANGSFNIVISDGRTKRTISLNRPNIGLLVVPGIWRELEDFSAGANCVVLASLKYDENDYIRDYSQFLRMKEC